MSARDELEGLAVGAGATLLLCGLAAWLGVWEPWEAQRAALLEDMLGRGELWRIPAAGGKPDTYVDALPYGWWPSLASVRLFGLNELGLRLPGLLFGATLLFALFSVTRSLYGRAAAWFATLAALCMPLFTFHARHMLDAGPEMAVIGLASLAMLRVAGDDEAGAGWRFGAWLATALAGLFSGVVGLATPLVAGLAAAWVRRGDGALRRVFAPAPMVVALLMVGAGWLVAMNALPADGDRAALLLWSEPLQGVDARKSWPSFEKFVHQVGFGLYPVAALVPFAFATMLWREPESDEPRGAPAADIGVSAWFALAFLGPALTVPQAHVAFFLGAPAVAVAVGAYLARVLRQPPQPLLGIATAIVLLILHHNLRHDTHYLADTLVGASVDSFPPTLPAWEIGGRWLGYGTLVFVLLYQTNARLVAEWIGREVLYPRRRAPSWLSGVFALAGLAIVGAVAQRRAEWLDPLVQLKVWGAMVPGARRAIIVLGLAVVVGFVLRLLWNLRAAQLAGRREGRLGRALESAAAALRRPLVAPVLVGGCLAGWAVFQNVPLARSLSTNFSQRDLIEHYAALAQGGEKLFKYGVDRNEISFYARRLDEMTAADFKAKATGDERFFAIVPRPRLATVNAEFRTVTGRTLPVLDDESSRFLLVSNQLRDGEADRNPITRALVTALPATAKKVSVNFEDQLELVGWEVEPAVLRGGTNAKLTMYWKVLKKTPYNWKVFVHIDDAGSRVHGDHDPVAGLYPTTNWAPGDIIRDEHRLTVKNTQAAGRYTFWAGLYRGDTRMKINAGDKDGENRARLGHIQVR